MRMLEMDDCIASKHYAEHVGKPSYQRLVDFMASDRIVALVVEGENAIERVRELHGKTDPNLAQPGTILCFIFKTVNTVHASDSPANAEREVHVFFSEAEIYMPNHDIDFTLAYIMVIDKKEKICLFVQKQGIKALHLYLLENALLKILYVYKLMVLLMKSVLLSVLLRALLKRS